MTKEIQQKIEEEKSAPQGNPFAGLFNSPDFWTKVSTNPELREYLKQPDFLQKVQQIQANPNSINQHLQDPRIMKLVMSVLNLGGMNPSEGGEDEPMTEHVHDENCKHDEPKKPAPKEEPKQEEKKGSSEALAEKEKGNALFKQKKFDEALVHYQKAQELDPNDITYRLNTAAVLIEQTKYDEAVKVCEEAIEFGRQNRADFKLIGRALERMGNAHFRKKDYRSALKCYNDSLTEEASREVSKKKQQAEQLLAKQVEEEYKSPEKAEEARLRGNDLYKQNKYPEAMKEYNEAIKRDPTKPNYYFNRGSCYMKLGEPNYALKDIEKTLEMDEKYIKAYARKAQCHTMRKEYHKSVDTFKQGLALDPNNEECKQGLQQIMMLINSKSRERDEDRIRMAQQDPEIMMIMQDPVMKQVLQDFAENPREAQKHTQNPQVMARLEKLINAGLIQTG